jgi:hypothetical protein
VILPVEVLVRPDGSQVFLRLSDGKDVLIREGRDLVEFAKQLETLLFPPQPKYAPSSDWYKRAEFYIDEIVNLVGNKDFATTDAFYRDGRLQVGMDILLYCHYQYGATTITKLDNADAANRCLDILRDTMIQAARGDLK